MLNDKIVMFDEDDKAILLVNLDSKVDIGIRELVDEINKFEDLVTMNSCQGTLIQEESDKHCPITYVDFYVLYNEHDMANRLMSELVSEHGSRLECRIWFEADFDYVDDDEIKDNGYVNLRYKIQLNDPDIELYEDVINTIKQFRIN